MRKVLLFASLAASFAFGSDALAIKGHPHHHPPSTGDAPRSAPASQPSHPGGGSNSK